MRSLAWLAFEWDARHGVQHRAILKRNHLKTRGRLFSGKVHGVHIGMPCNTYSRDRNFDGGTPALRSDEHVDGLPGLSSGDAQKVKLGKILARFALSIFHLCRLLGIPCILETLILRDSGF